MKQAIRNVLFLVPVLFLATFAKADNIAYGRPVASTSSITTVGLYNSSTHETTFYIPLSYSASGVYGVGGVGTSPDIGTGYGYDNPYQTALTMNLFFDPVDFPAATASLSFTFQDLDLSPVNDPFGFFESVQFFAYNGSGGFTALDAVPITSTPQSATSPFAYTVTGNGTTQSVVFSNVASVLKDPFYVQLKFDSKYNTLAVNTPESMVAKLTTTPVSSVPEPTSLLLLGTGAAGLFMTKRRKLA